MATAETGQFTADTEQAVVAALEDFREQFVSADGKPLAEGDNPAKAMGDEDLSHEQIVVQKKRS